VIEALADRRAPLGFYQGGWEADGLVIYIIYTYIIVIQIIINIIIIIIRCFTI